MRLLLGAALVASVSADVYMHNPRGGNNRLNEKSANRNNGNRLFDSQNNNRGGYNVGDKTHTAFSGNNPYKGPAATMNVNNNDATQYQMAFFEESELSIEWTNQHGCGGREVADEGGARDTHKLNCNIVLQYTCDTDASVTDKAMTVNLMDGGNTNTPDAPTNVASITTTMNNNNNNQRGRHESEAYYFECKERSRNMGLFIADQNVKGSDARYTRQNPNANRRGLECPEERDYYPYWAPTPWVDVAYLTDTLSHCPMVLNNTQNTNMQYKCTGAYTEGKIQGNLYEITEEGCLAREAEHGAMWAGFTHGVAAPDCTRVGWSRVNHLGNGRDAQPLTYNWTLPKFDEIPNAQVFDSDFKKCVLRLRYNISTDDYDPWNTDSRHNHNKAAGVVSPVQQNPTVDVGANLQGLRLAINTAQFGRTFQDRSHVFYVRKRPAGFQGTKIYNLNVRGKRGNIVQTYPSVEYDFVPSRLHVDQDDLVHLQWTGSNTHVNGNPAGDGQAGDAGEGTSGTDRSNVVQSASASDNYPIPLDKFPENIFTTNDCYDTSAAPISSTDCALTLATSGQYRTVAAVSDDPDDFSVLLNKAPASLVGGVIMQMTTPGDYHYMCTRNNNFSNRSQKGSLVVAPTPQE